MPQPVLFPEIRSSVPEEEVVAALRAVILRAGRLPRSADLMLAGICAERLVEGLYDAGLEVVRRPEPRLRE